MLFYNMGIGDWGLGVWGFGFGGKAPAPKHQHKTNNQQ